MGSTLVLNTLLRRGEDGSLGQELLVKEVLANNFPRGGGKLPLNVVHTHCSVVSVLNYLHTSYHCNVLNFHVTYYFSIF